MTNNEKLETVEETLQELFQNLEYDLQEAMTHMEIEKIKYYQFVVNNMLIILGV